MSGGDEVDVLASALAAIGLDEGEVEVLADHRGRRRVIRVADVVVKAFASAELDAWQREAAGLRAVAGRAWAPELVAVGERWSATRWIDGVVPMHTDVGEVEIHRALGPALVALYTVPPVGLPSWSVVDRLRARLADPPPTCPPALRGAVADLVAPLLGTITPPNAFVHGDWGTANVLVDPADHTHVVAVIDFEDAHAGDAAEDCKWQVLAGPASDQFVPMAETYRAAGGDLGPNATERLVVCGAELCLDVLGWSVSGDTADRFWGRCRQTLEDLVAGQWPDWP